MISLDTYEKNIYSRDGDDGITMKLLELIYDGDNKNKFFVEFGVGNGDECNTRLLRKTYNWNGLQLDSGHKNIKRNLQREFITKENIVDLFVKYNVPSNINYLSVDIDFNDFYCLREILKRYTCDIIICEYNGTHLPNEDKIIVYNKHGHWDGKTNYFGASLLSFSKLCTAFNYSLVYCDNRGVNCFFVHNDIIKNKGLQFLNCGDINKLYKSPKYGGGPNGGHFHDHKNRPYISYEQAMNI